MAESPILQKVNLVTFDVLVDGKALDDECQVTNITVTKKINKVAFAEFTVLDGNPSSMKFEHLDKNLFEPGKNVKINLGYHSNNETIFEGVVVKVEIDIRNKKHPTTTIKCADKAISMTLARHSAYYLKMSDSDIINKIAGNYGLSKQVESTSEKHDETIQYQAIDWDFVLARAELNGQIVITDNNKLVVKKPNVSSGDVGLTYGTDIIRTNLSVDATQQISKIVTSAWDFSNQKIIEATSSEPTINAQGNGSTKGKKLSDIITSDDYEMHVTAPLKQGALKAWADGRLLRSRLSRIRGHIIFQGTAKAAVDDVINLEGVGNYFNGKAYVSGVKQTIKNGNWLTEVQIGLEHSWFTEAQPNVTAPIASGLLPGINGLYNGVVKKIDSDPDGETRIQVDIPVIDPSGDGVWARYSNPYATDKAGVFFMPEIGDEVILGFLGGDPRYPVILGSMYGNKHQPPYTPDSGNTIKAIVTNSQLKMIFEDDKKNIIIETPAGNKITISDEDKSIKLEDQNRNVVLMNNKGVSIDTPKDIVMTAKGKITLDAMQKITIKSTANVETQGMNVSTKANTQLSMQGLNAELKGSAMTTIQGGLVKIN